MTRRRIHRVYNSTSYSEPLLPIVQLWILRVLVTLGGHRDLLNHRRFDMDDALPQAVGLKDISDLEDDDISSKHNQRKMLTYLRKQLTTAERKRQHAVTLPCLHNNIARLSDVVGLSQADCRILEFAVLLQTEKLLEEATDLLGQLSTLKVHRILSTLLDIPDHEIKSSLGTQNILTNSGLLSVTRSGTGSLREKLNLLSDNFADHITSAESDPVSLLRDIVIPSSPGHLVTDDFRHIAPALNVLRPYLKHATETRRCGVNILLYGAPGTGKTQLAKLLSQELDYELFEVTSEDENGDPVHGGSRLCAYRAAQYFFAQNHTIILFDEAEDIFYNTHYMTMSLQTQNSNVNGKKAWMNRMLEGNAVITLWLSNSIAQIDPAFIRRFDMVIELPIPPKKQRERIIRDTCPGLLNTASISRIAESESLAPAIITKAASVVNAIRSELDEDGITQAMYLLLNNTLQAQGHKAIQKHDSNRLPEIYDPGFIHASADLAQVADGLVQSGSGRLCLFGPPGTGKTAYGRWLAEQLNVPLMIRKSSDLLSMWVGGTEKNMADAFRQAEQDGALLLIDEVDSFLQDRRNATRSWEVTAVNEMLTQMESFSGVFIASTNLMDGLDQAALRRFDLKVKFDFLKPDQSWDLLCRHCSSMAIQAPALALKSQLASLANLTPGDFAAVVRQSRFRPITSAATMVAALEAECGVKENSKAAIGFVH